VTPTPVQVPPVLPTESGSKYPWLSTYIVNFPGTKTQRLKLT